MPRWRKLGLIYAPRPSGQHPKLLTHAANPLAVRLSGDVYRVFFSGRDAFNRSSVGAVDIDLDRLAVAVAYEAPWFVHGPPGSFYADGVSIGNIYSVGADRFMPFMGWQSPKDGHWRGDIGRLLVGSDLTLSLDGEGPFLGVDPIDPVSLSYPWVDGNERGGFSMWYGSTVAWDAGNGEMLHVIQRATSPDGHHWARHGLALPYQLGVAQAFSRPTVMTTSEGDHHMWFSYRGAPPGRYKIGYAHSADGMNWRLDLANAGIDVSPAGWDSEMIEYPFVFSHGGETFMLYNGNAYGKTGFGLAVLVRA